MALLYTKAYAVPFALTVGTLVNKNYIPAHAHGYPWAAAEIPYSCASVAVKADIHTGIVVYMVVPTPKLFPVEGYYFNFFTVQPDKIINVSDHAFSVLFILDTDRQIIVVSRSLVRRIKRYVIADKAY